MGLFTKRKVILGVLITVGIIFAILITTLVFLLWKHLQKVRHRKQNGLLKNAGDSLDHFDADMFTVKRALPLDCRTVLGQEPVAYECLPPTPLPGTMGLKKLQRVPSRQGSKYKKVSDSRLSLVSECDEEFLLGGGGSTCTESDEEDEEEVLGQPGELRTVVPLTRAQQHQQRTKKRKTIALHGYSLSEDMFTQSNGNSNDSNAGRRSSKKNTEPAPKSRDQDTKKTFADIVQPRKLKDQGILVGLQPKGIYKQVNKPGLQQRGLFKRGGKIIFKTKYNEWRQELELLILKAFDLTATRDMTEIIPFVRVCLLPGKKQKQDTRHKKQSTREPFFNEKIIFQGLKKDELASMKLNIKVCNYSRVKRKDVIGEAELAMTSLDLYREKSFCITLFQKRYEVSSASISVSVCHAATEAKLVVIIHEAHLPRSGKPMLQPNLYAVITLHKAEHSVERKQTTLKRTSPNPVFEERFEFPIRTTTAEDLGIYSLDLTLIHNNYVGKRSSIGHVVLSLMSSQKTAEDQWKSCVDVPHKSHRAVHALIDPGDL